MANRKIILWKAQAWVCGLGLGLSGVVLSNSADEAFSDHQVIGAAIGILVSGLLTWIGYSVTSTLGGIRAQLTAIERHVNSLRDRLIVLETINAIKQTKREDHDA